MKFLKGLFITLFVLIFLIFGGAFIFIKTFDINKHRDQIAAEIGKAIGRTVTISKLTLNLSLVKGVYAEVNGLTVSEDKSFGDSEFASVAKADVGVDVMTYLKKREIVVTKVGVEGIKLHVIKDAQGVMNVQKIGPAGSSASSEQGPTTATAPAKSPSLPNISVQSIFLQDVEVVYEDRALAAPMNIVIKDIYFLVNNFSLQAPFKFEAGAAVFGASQNVQITGQSRVDVAAQQAVLTGLEVRVDFSKVSVADLVKAVPSAAGANSISSLQGQAVIKVPSLTVGAAGVGDLSLTAQLGDVKVAVVLPEGMNFVGAVNANLSLSGKNPANPDEFLNSLNGSGMFDVKDGQITNSNVLKMILGRIDVIPGLAAAVEASIPEQYRKDFLSDQTVFQKIGSPIEINNGVVSLPDLQVIASLFAATMQISADPKMNGKVAGRLTVPADLTAGLVTGAPALEYLRDGEGRLTISLMPYEGPLASMKVLPDVKDLAKSALQNEGKRQLGTIINKALGVEDAPAPVEGGETPVNAGEEIIGGVLDKLFK